MIQDTHVSHHFDSISAIDHKILKSPLTWFWRHVKGHQDDQTGPLDRWSTLNVGCDAELKKWKLDHEVGFITTRSHIVQYENWRLFTNVPTSSYGKRNTTLGDKISTNLMDSIDKSTFKKNLLSRWHKIDTLHERLHHWVDWYALKAATKNIPRDSSDG